MIYLILYLILPYLASSQIIMSNSAEEAQSWLKKLIDLKSDQTTTLINYSGSYAIINQQISEIWDEPLIKINDDINQIKMNQIRLWANEHQINIQECEAQFTGTYWTHKMQFNDALSNYNKEIGIMYYTHYNRLKVQQETYAYDVAQFETEISICDSDSCFEQLVVKMRPEYGKGKALFGEIAYYSQEFTIIGSKNLGLLLDSTATFMRQALVCEDVFAKCVNDKDT